MRKLVACSFGETSICAKGFRLLGGLDDRRRPSGVMQADEICFPLSFKGGGDSEVKPPRRIGQKKGGLFGEQVCISCALDPDRRVVARVAKLGKNFAAGPGGELLAARSPTAPQTFPTPIPLTKSSANEADSGMSNCQGERAKECATSKPSTAAIRIEAMHQRALPWRGHEMPFPLHCLAQPDPAQHAQKRGRAKDLP